MQMRNSALRIIILSAILVVLVSVSGGFFVKAQTEIDKDPAGQGSGSSSSQPTASSSVPASPEGAPSTTSALDPNAVGSGAVVSANDPDALAPRPDGLAPNAVMKFLFVAGSAFHPRNSTYTYAESADGGCIYQTGGESIISIFVNDLQLPDGATVDILRLFYYDTSAADSMAWITQYDGADGFVDIAHIASSGTAGYGNTAINTFTYTVNDYDYPIVLNWRPYQLGVSSKLCGVRIRYWTATTSSFMQGASGH
jgi:hypothetical protein